MYADWTLVGRLELQKQRDCTVGLEEWFSAPPRLRELI